MARYRNVCFTWNNPEGIIEFVPAKMHYLVYQEEISASGTYHFQGYCEFTKQMRKDAAKELLGGRTVHVEFRGGTAEEAAAYCKKQFNDDGSDKRLAGTEPFEAGEMRVQGKRTDLVAFRDAVFSGARQRDLVEDFASILARYPKFYQTLTWIRRPIRKEELVVTLLYGSTGTGKTKAVHDRHEKDLDFWRQPLNNGTMWFDGYDFDTTVLLDDFAGKASHVHLCALLQLLDIYPISVPTKGAHAWWMPTRVFVTTNLLPKHWYSWENRGQQYLALARRFHFVYHYHVPLSDTDCGFELVADATVNNMNWWQEEAPEEALQFY